eukprot:scaffold124862_cov32-Tisochrysis_lutea.AAC.1
MIFSKQQMQPLKVIKGSDSKVTTTEGGIGGLTQYDIGVDIGVNYVAVIVASHSALDAHQTVFRCWCHN